MPKIKLGINVVIDRQLFRSGSEVTVSDLQLKELQEGPSKGYVTVVDEPKQAVKTVASRKKTDTNTAE